MACCVRQKFAARRLARQYAIEMTRECQENGCAPETVTPEAVMTRMQEDGLVTEGVDWGNLLEFLMTLIQMLARFFGPTPVPTTESAPAEKNGGKKS